MYASVTSGLGSYLPLGDSGVPDEVDISEIQTCPLRNILPTLNNPTMTSLAFPTALSGPIRIGISI